MSLSVKGFKYRTIGTTNALLCPEPIHPPPSLRVEVRVFSAKMIKSENLNKFDNFYLLCYNSIHIKKPME